MYINRIENRITFKIKSGYYFELLTPETMKLLGSTESKIAKDKNGKNCYLEKEINYMLNAKVMIIHLIVGLIKQV